MWGLGGFCLAAHEPLRVILVMLVMRHAFPSMGLCSMVWRVLARPCSLAYFNTYLGTALGRCCVSGACGAALRLLRSPVL